MKNWRKKKVWIVTKLFFRSRHCWNNFFKHHQTHTLSKILTKNPNSKKKISMLTLKIWSNPDFRKRYPGNLLKTSEIWLKLQKKISPGSDGVGSPDFTAIDPCSYSSEFWSTSATGSILPVVYYQRINISKISGVCLDVVIIYYNLQSYFPDNLI